MTEPRSIIRLLAKAGDLSEVAHTSTFTARRGHRTVTIHVHDRGPGASSELRYCVTATAEDGATATGNPAESVETVLATLHWKDLDR